MAQLKGIDWKNVTFVVGHRSDLAPASPGPVFQRSCGNCQAATITEVEYPLDVLVLCNVCSGQLSAELEEEGATQLLYDMPIPVKARLIDLAQECGLPIETVLKDFLDWKLGRVTNASYYPSAGEKQDQGEE
jgi:hypothetical protein